MAIINTKKRFRQGAASFYMVAIATLVLVIIATSFAAIIVAEIARTSNDDLAQSAYDAAMAGVEDAKLAYYSYTNCMKSGGSGCEDYLGNSDKCNTFVGKLGRGESGKEVKVQEGSENNMEQAYTCVKISKPNDYTYELSGDTPTAVVKVKLADGEEASDVKSVNISWGLRGGVGSVDSLPGLEIGLIQTAEEFDINSFEMTKDRQTNRGMVFLKPVNTGGTNEISAEDGFLKSNNKVAWNDYHKVTCSDNAEPQCSVSLGLPQPVGGERSEETFMFVWSLLGGSGDATTVTMSLCSDIKCEDIVDDDSAGGDESVVGLDMQVKVDSTGRANDLYKRVEVRLENEPVGTQKIYALMAENIIKDYATCENNFIETPNCE